MGRGTLRQQDKESLHLTDTLNVLYYGHDPAKPCPYYRGTQFDTPIRAHGVNQRYLVGLSYDFSSGNDGQPIGVDTEPLEWADLIVFRRFYDTQKEIEKAVAAGFPPFSNTHWLWSWAVKLGKPYVYDTDDDPLTMTHWNAQWPVAEREREFVREMARKAALVTVATPALAERYRAYNRNIRVIRNAVDPELYRPSSERQDPRTKVLFYACAEARLRDYFGEQDITGRWQGGYAAAAVRASGAQKIFFGWEGGAAVPQHFDECIRYVEGIPEFARTMANIHADVGVAPLIGDAFDRAKSELHWLEYTCVGIPTVAQRLMRPAPYDVIRDGTDGILARGAFEWSTAVKRLVNNPTLRADLVAAAKERIASEYDYRIRAAEWADAFHSVV